MTAVHRRRALGLAATGLLAGLTGAVLGAPGSRAFATAASRTHFRALVIGSGFGGSVTALRLGRAGVDTLVLERGREWPTHPGRPLFGSPTRVTDTMFWFRGTTRWPAMLPVPVRPAPGIMEVSQERHLDIACGAAVGGGSVIYTGTTVAPPRHYFERLYPSGLTYDELVRTWYPAARAALAPSPMPADVYHSVPFTHSRLWDRQVANARLRTRPLDSTFDWDVVRGELTGTHPLSATIGESDFGCGSGAKRDLTRTYLPAALATGSVQLRALHEVRSVGRRPGGGYTVAVRRLDEGGATLGTTEYTCDLLFLAAGTLNTNRLLVAAREEGRLPDLPADVGSGFGDNGSQFDLRSQPLHSVGPAQAAPCASGAFLPDAFELPLLAENCPPAPTAPASSTPTPAPCPCRSATPTPSPRTPWAAASSAGRPTWRARVRGHRGLYVMDGSLLPGSAGGANPSLTITALAERALSRIVAAGG
ncbi:GMC oxidoreductase [Streptomyces sp. TRM 70351]|uniref:GMC family oxidoreductase N-terminal domain-containing protein n=1 Tax=Streptomyces sp. TRM 70351 TaxID=3116552 RepID=UPI002E7AF958|nr:GMC oxidoreductase [Streptomyces sp. TRM 70351]MEE1930108.1 GMC oxidoreductase [Streptomyces sp. TRM 70351]